MTKVEKLFAEYVKLREAVQKDKGNSALMEKKRAAHIAYTEAWEDEKQRQQGKPPLDRSKKVAPLPAEPEPFNHVQAPPPPVELLK